MYIGDFHLLRAGNLIEPGRPYLVKLRGGRANCPKGEPPMSQMLDFKFLHMSGPGHSQITWTRHPGCTNPDLARTLPHPQG